MLGPGNEAEAARYQDACAHRQDSVDKGDSYKTVATVVGIGAGVMAVTTVVLYFVTAEREETRARVVVARAFSACGFAVGLREARAD